MCSGEKRNGSKEARQNTCVCVNEMEMTLGVKVVKVDLFKYLEIIQSNV